ncbi:CidA/LrgA family protein [Halovulum sp. GXIMD14794]
MINALTIFLLCQFAGEVVAAFTGSSVPGPVIGMGLLLALFLAFDRLVALVRPTATALLANLSLLFVPAGVGIAAHLSELGPSALGLFIAILVSTVLAICAGAWTFMAVARLTGDRLD